MSTSRPTTGWPMAVARYRLPTSHAVCDGGAPNAAPMGTSETARIDELIGLRIEPSIIGASRRRSNALGFRALLT